ncbi:MAG TPA: NAD(P)H-dependent oxidoreductase [Terriglobales bacterium]|jgi:NAD(P)H-dependent FMN reductase/catechol 2,3-dioxygenase-like lactoylglutathione lyase family enzyme
MLVPIQSLFEAHLHVSDLRRSLSFYGELLGLPIAANFPDRRAAFLWVGAPGKAMLGLWDSGTTPQRLELHLAFSVALEDLLNAAGKLQNAGIQPLDFDGRPTDGPVVLAWMPAASLYFRDPDNNLLEFITMLHDSPSPDLGVVPWKQWLQRNQANDGIDTEASMSREIDLARGEKPINSGPRIRILGISGSLRPASTNTALLRAAALVAPPSVEVKVWEQLGSLPYFNPELEGDLPVVVREFRQQVASSSAIIFSTPEYAHGLPGALKNALDWLVGGNEFPGKPVMLLNASERGTFAQDSLIEVVKTMSGRVVRDAGRVVPLLGKSIDARSLSSDPAIAATLREGLATFSTAIAEMRGYKQIPDGE